MTKIYELEEDSNEMNMSNKVTEENGGLNIKTTQFTRRNKIPPECEQESPDEAPRRQFRKPKDVQVDPDQPVQMRKRTTSKNREQAKERL